MYCYHNEQVNKLYQPFPQTENIFYIYIYIYLHYLVDLAITLC